MLLEAILAYAHFAAILGVVVFVTSEAALCRPEWLNAAVIHRLVRIDTLYLAAAAVVLLTGLARTFWGIKGVGWYWTQPLLHAKLTIFAFIGVLSLKPTFSFLRWRKRWDELNVLPAAAEVLAVRRIIMFQAHVMLLIPLAATLLARGVWAF